MNREMFWRIINYAESHSSDKEEQLKTLQLILSELDKKTIKQIKEIWGEVREEYKSVPNLNDIQSCKGGFVNEFKDVNNYDFINWLIMQGSRLYEEVVVIYGTMAIATYFIKYRMDRKQCYFYDTKTIFDIKPYDSDEQYNRLGLNKITLNKSIKIIEVLVGENNIATKVLKDKLNEYNTSI
ncbi:TPA: DUF4240 domain-containing protein [Clostridium botulinum]|nr:DUF4240 domain-containing protein [Clostridium botulinum]HBJ1652673.1 DUF4240 domain-containing protein [Clostridium botulinum]